MLGSGVTGTWNSSAAPPFWHLWPMLICEKGILTEPHGTPESVAGGLQRSPRQPSTSVPTEHWGTRVHGPLPTVGQPAAARASAFRFLSYREVTSQPYWQGHLPLSLLCSDSRTRKLSTSLSRRLD